jgi:malic enzyme
MNDKKLNKESLKYHEKHPSGKIGMTITKPCNTQQDLTLAYSPGVAEPCRKIHKNVDDVYKYTNKGNTIAVVSDGTAVLGLGNIGAEASLPVMEGKAVLFKRFAGIDAVPICLNTIYPDEIVEIVKSLEPSFGGINLEDIKAPECFYIEERLKSTLNIPVFHDDQHGTAIICLAGIINGLKLANKKLSDVKFVINGAGAAGISCAKLCIEAGAKKENFILCDSKGVIYKGRKKGMSHEKKEYANYTSVRTLKEALVGADIFLGLSVGNCVTPDMIKSMNDKSIVFAMANPVPEINPELAKEAGAFIVGTGRSDYNNQVNNVMGFPGIFRGALDVRAKDITIDMQLEASRALAELVDENELSPDYVIPNPLDERVVPRVAKYVAKCAMETGQSKIDVNLDSYEDNVKKFIMLQNY